MKASDRFIIRKLAFVGVQKRQTGLEFVPGLNVIWGASNTGKSFTIKALDYMFGAGTKLPENNQRAGYETCWLELDLPKNGRTTISRSLAGGGFNQFNMAFADALNAAPTRKLAASHSLKTDSLSSFLLSELGISDSKIASTLNGDKKSFTVRCLAPYIFTEETPMMSEASPIQIDPKSNETFDKNVLKFILTGIDDSAIVTTKNPADQKLANSGRVEIITEMISSTETEIKELFPDDDAIDVADLETQEERLSASIANYQSILSERQNELDGKRRNRRAFFDDAENLKSRSEQILLMLERFALLLAVYDSDLERLDALDEGAAALLASAKRPCPVCGASIEHQHEIHGLKMVEHSQSATHAEKAKIKAERSDLIKTINSLHAEREGLEVRHKQLTTHLNELDAEISRLKPLEAEGRRQYEDIDKVRQRIRSGLSLTKRLENLKLRKAQLEAFKPITVPRDSISVGISGVLGHDFAKTVQDILWSWNFPGKPTVSFNSQSHDIEIDGKDRRGNGKGVRALMNAAFKIGVLVYCRNHNLPHPGIVALDSPLLSYRDPHTSRHGELSADEEQVTASGLNSHFYNYLTEQSKFAQFIVVENDAPPDSTSIDAKITVFAGRQGEGLRQGLF